MAEDALKWLMSMAGVSRAEHSEEKQLSGMDLTQLEADVSPCVSRVNYVAQSRPSALSV
jgi:hypothetical protein